jgi:thioredoxin reductase (NADPH)
MIKTDAFILGKGPAGIQASLYIKRANIDPIVVGKDIGMCVKAREVENFYGIDSISGPDLVEKGIAQARRLGICVESDEVVSLSFDGDGFVVKTKTETYHALSFLFASGTHRSVPRIRNINKFDGKGVSYCAVCDAFFYRNKVVAVIGEGDYASSEANELLAVASKVYVLTDGKEPAARFDERVEVITDKIVMLEGDDTVSSVVLEGKTLDVEGVFVALGTASSTDLAQKLGVETNNNRIVVNEHMETNMPGMFAAGDCTPGIQQIAKAVGDGCVAGMRMAAYIRKVKRERAQ